MYGYLYKEITMLIVMSHPLENFHLQHIFVQIELQFILQKLF